MKMTLRATFVICGILCVQLPMSAQEKKYVMLPHKDPSTAQGMEGGMWRTDANFESILHLKNVLLNHPLIATPILYMADGTEYQLPPITLEPAGVASVNIGTALNEMPLAISAHRSLYGMVGVKYNWSWIAMMALVRNIDEAEMVSFHSSLHADVNESHPQSAAQKLQQIEGLWWKPYETTDGFLFLSNTLLKPLQVTVAAYDSTGNALGQKAVTLSSHASVRLMLSDVLGTQPAVGATGSLKITYQGPINGLSAVGGLEDDTNGYSTTFDLQEMHPERTRNPAVHQVVLDAPGVMIGQQEPRMQFPENTVFTPYGYLHNTSAQTRQVSVTVTVAGPRGPQTYTIGALTLAPYSTHEIDYKDFLRKLSLPRTTSIDISLGYTGNDGDVQVEGGSIDQTGNYVFQDEPQTENWTISRTICHWELHDETDSMISLWNYSSAPEDLKLTLYYTGGQYVVPIHLEPRADYEFDLATLVHSGQPDADGSVIPQSITEGSAILADAHDDANHILVASSAAVFNTRTATCGPTCQYCNGVSGIIVIPGPVLIGFNSTAQAQAQMTYNTGSISTTTTGGWRTSNTAITTVNSSGLVSGVGVGSDDIYDDFSNIPSPAGYICLVGSCPLYNTSGSGTANVPPTLTSSVPLWFFGSRITPPSTFGQGNVTSVITANGASGGSFAWTITNGATKVSFASGSQQSSTTTSANTVSVYSIGYSTSVNDVTISLTWTPSGGSAMTSTLNLSVDSPYKLTLVTSSGPTGVKTCSPFTAGTPTIGWWLHYTWRELSFLGQAISGVGINENFTLQADITTNNWPLIPNGESPVAGSSSFSDDYYACHGTLLPAPTGPQSPLSSTVIFTAGEYYYVGSSTIGSGIEVQSQLLTDYIDHATVTSIVSPVR